MRQCMIFLSISFKKWKHKTYYLIGFVVIDCQFLLSDLYKVYISRKLIKERLFFLYIELSIFLPYFFYKLTYFTLQVLNGFWPISIEKKEYVGILSPIWRFSEMGVPPNHPFSLVFPYKPSILRYPHLWKPPNIYSNVLVITGSTTWVGYRFPEVVFTARPSLGCHGCHLLVMGSIPHQSLGHHEIAPGFRF